MIDERLSRNSIARSELVISYKNDQQQFDSLGTGKSQSGHQDKVSEENCEPSENLEIPDKARESLKHISRIYNRWEHLFQEEKTAKALPKHQS
jgi:hypothetical protein